MGLLSNRTALFGGAAVCLVVLGPAFAGDLHTFDIPAGSAQDSIQELADQANRQIIAPGYALTGIRTAALRGTIDTATALSVLLKDTNLSVASDYGRTVILKVSPAAIPHGQTRSTPQTAPSEQDVLESVTVTGFRASIERSLTAKRSATNFTNSVFAEDIGKFPDLNIAEAINRVPGVQLIRDQTGEGVQVVVRGLGPSFTQVLMNGHPIEVATDGITGAGNQNREVDLDMFPVELFTNIIVSKTPTAAMYESGIAGAVNMGTVKPFDNPEEGFHLNYSLQNEYSNAGGTFSPRGAIIASQIFGNKLGILIGVAGQHYKWRNDGYESVGNALADVIGQQPSGSCPDCNTIGTGKNFHWATVVPPDVAPNASLGIGTTGTSYNYAGTVSTAGGTSGLSTTDLSNVIMPYLARYTDKFGSKDRMSFLGDAQYRPSDNLEINSEILFENSQRAYRATDLDWFVRNSCNADGTASSCMIPVNVQIDSMHHLTSGSFLNSAFFLEDSQYRENIRFIDINPTVDWTPRPWLKIHGAVDYNDSYMHRRNWT